MLQLLISFSATPLIHQKGYDPSCSSTRCRDHIAAVLRSLHGLQLLVGGLSSKRQCIVCSQVLTKRSSITTWQNSASWLPLIRVISNFVHYPWCPRSPESSDFHRPKIFCCIWTKDLERSAPLHLSHLIFQALPLFWSELNLKTCLFRC